jgi:hypothetical protein
MDSVTKKPVPGALVNWAADANNACYAIYYQSGNSMYLLNDNTSQSLAGVYCEPKKTGS